MEVKGVDIIRGDLLFLSLHHKVYGKNFHFCISFNDKHTYKSVLNHSLNKAISPFLDKLAKRRASPGYARDHGIGSSEFLDLYEILVLSRFHGRYFCTQLYTYLAMRHLSAKAEDVM